MAHFAIAHLPVRQADKMLRRANQRVRKLAQQLVIRRLARQSDRVVRGFGAITPSVQDGTEKRGKDVFLGTKKNSELWIFFSSG